MLGVGAIRLTARPRIRRRLGTIGGAIGNGRLAARRRGSGPGGLTTASGSGGNGDGLGGKP